jgi:hypothetical protein
MLCMPSSNVLIESDQMFQQGRPKRSYDASSIPDRTCFRASIETRLHLGTASMRKINDPQMCDNVCNVKQAQSMPCCFFEVTRVQFTFTSLPPPPFATPSPRFIPQWMLMLLCHRSGRAEATLYIDLHLLIVWLTTKFERREDLPVHSILSLHK